MEDLPVWKHWTGVFRTSISVSGVNGEVFSHYGNKEMVTCSDFSKC